MQAGPHKTPRGWEPSDVVGLGLLLAVGLVLCLAAYLMKGDSREPSITQPAVEQTDPCAGAKELGVPCTERDPATGEPAPVIGTPEHDDMERRELKCWDSGRTDCADHPGDYLKDPSSYP